VSSKGRTPFSFHKAYCDGHLGDYGWEADGRSERAETELVRRLGLVMVKRPRSVIWANTPPKTRQVVRLDIGAVQEDSSTLAKRLASETHLFKHLEALLPLYAGDVAERVVENLINGEKDLVWVLTRHSVEIMAEALEKACAANDVRARLREAGVRIWATHGEADIKARDQLASEYRAHKGAGVLVATMDSLPESISLYGATTEHYAQLHFQAGPMEQSENRPYLRGTSKLHILYYVPKNSVMERLESLVIPRLTTADKIGDSRDAAATAKAFEKQEETWEEMLTRLCSGGPEDGEPDLFSSSDAEDADLLESLDTDK